MVRKILYSKLPTEQSNPASRNLDRLTPEAIVSLMNREDRRVVQAVRNARREIAKSVAMVVESLSAGGRLFFVGAGTSGRLGFLEAAECPPTFNTPPSLVQAIMAGGKRAVFRSQEGAEDREAEGRRTVRARVRAGDIVVGIAASGVTPFVRGALLESKRLGARRVLVAANANTSMNAFAESVIVLRVGPEVLAGSTRLKAGSATKMALNMLTTASMVQLGKVYGNLMVDLQPRSKKLKARALRLIEELASVTPAQARHYLRRANGRAKVAIVMARTGLPYRGALRKLEESKGALGVLLDEVLKS